ncbi:MAG: ribonuclease P protein component [bacterium]|nr:ribonuclease P protein component [bacterium]
MLPRAHRLVRERDFREVLKEHKGFREGGLFLKAKKRSNSSLRFGIVVGKNVSAKATSRNRFRRVLAEALQKKLSEIKEGHDAVIIALPRAELKSLAEAEIVLEKLLRKASLLKHHP